MPASPRASSRLLAWGVHALTASGVVLALLALRAIVEQRPDEALLWLFAAMIVDGVDGTLARAVQVKQRVPRIDGEALDLVVDYLTWVFVPALLIWRMGVLPETLGLPLTALILVSSLYVFARRDMKTDDGYFRGFPAMWNVVALYYFAAPPGPGVAAAIVAVLALLTFAPVHVVHPFRVKDYGAWLPATALVWGVATAALLIRDVPMREVLLIVSLASAAVLAAMGLRRSFRR
jgi:phosphatidylcholine synthase